MWNIQRQVHLFLRLGSFNFFKCNETFGYVLIRSDAKAIVEFFVIFYGKYDEIIPGCLLFLIDWAVQAVKKQVKYRS